MRLAHPNIHVATPIGTAGNGSQQQKKEDEPLSLDFVLDFVRNYMTKMAGVDMVVKLFGYLLRFKILFLSQSSRTPAETELLRSLKAMLLSIIESRMLANSCKGLSTFNSSLKVLVAPANPFPPPAAAAVGFPSSPGSTTSWADGVRSALEKPTQLMTVLALAMRALEQFSSDGGYLARYVFRGWSQDRLSYEYKRWKSLSLTCILLVEMAFLAKFVQQRASAKDSSSSAAVGSAELVAASPTNVLGPNALYRAQECKYRFQVLHTGAIISDRDALMSAIVSTRCVCDMYIYYRWSPLWNPPEFWQYAAGVVSAVLGIYLVADETVRETVASRAKQIKRA